MALNTNGVLTKVAELTDTFTVEATRRGRRALGDAAWGKSRQAEIRTEILTANERLASFLRSCYEIVDGWPINITPKGQLKIATPWGRNGRLTWDMPSGVADVLGVHMRDCCTPGHPAYPAPVDYDERSRRWYLNASTFPSRADALAWWERHKLTTNEYMRIAYQVRQ